MTPVAYGYVTSITYMGASWSHDPVTVYITLQKGVDPSYRAEVLKALTDWSDALKSASGNSGAFDFNVLDTPQSKKTPADITITLKKNTGAVLGSAQLSPSGETIVSAKIVLATQNSMGLPLGKEDFRNILRHELGHALGLGHANDNGIGAKDLMYPYYDFITVGYDVYPSNFDLNALIKLYGNDGFGGAYNLHPIPPSYP